MYSVIHKLKEIKASSFKIDNRNHVYINFGNHIEVFNGENIKKVFDSLDQPKVTLIKNEDIWIGEASTGKSFIYNNGKLKQTIDFIATIPLGHIKQYFTKEYIYPRIYLNGDFSTSYNARVSNRDYSIDGLLTDNLGFKGIYLVVNDNSFISHDNARVGLFDFRNNVIWQQSFEYLLESDEAIIRSHLLNYNGNVFFIITGNEKKGLFVLDIRSGQILKKFDGLCYEIFHDYEYIFTTRFHNILNRINTNSLEVEEWSVDELLKQENIRSIHDHRCAAHNNMFYFTQSIGDNKAKLGVLDWNNKKLVYKYEFKPENGAIGSIQANDTCIFVHTQDNTLHIFEKE